MNNERKQVILEKLASVIGKLLREPKGAVAYLKSRVPGGMGSNPMSYSKMLKRTRASTGTAKYGPGTGHRSEKFKDVLPEAFPILGGREARRLSTKQIKVPVN